MPSKKHKCIICNYSTDDLSNFNKHNISKKHIDRTTKKEQRKLNKLNKQKDAEFSKQSEINKDEYISELKKQLDRFADVCKMQFEVMKGQTEVSTKSMSAIKYLAKHHSSAPPVKQLKGKELTKLITYEGTKKYSLAEIIVHNYSQKTLHIFVGNLIIDKYKTDEPEDQSVWMSDISRLCFIIMEELKDGNSEWVKDKSGLKITKLIIIPIMEKIKDVLIQHSKNINDINIDPATDNETAKENLNILQIINCVIRDINLSKFNPHILKHIAPEFNLDIR